MLVLWKLVRISEDWPVWSHYPNSKVDGQENSIEFPLNSCPDFILLYMVCAQYWLSGHSMTHLLIPSYHSITDLAKHGDREPISPYKGRPALLRPSQSPIRHLLLLQFSECLLPPSTYHTALLWGLVGSWQNSGFCRVTHGGPSMAQLSLGLWNKRDQSWFLFYAIISWSRHWLNLLSIVSNQPRAVAVPRQKGLRQIEGKECHS